MLRGLYFIANASGEPMDKLLRTAESALQGGAALVQYRDKLSRRDETRTTAHALAALCRHYQRPLIINDHVALAADVGAHGVHLGLEDTELQEARRTLGASAIIGVSCHADLHCAMRMQERGADYVAFGRFHPSRTKPGAPAAPLAILAVARARLKIPVCAIGGITEHNAKPLIDAGADLIAVINAISDSPDPFATSKTFAGLFNREFQ
jgi:thiamine-phosphate pyrophosphorylase